MLSEFQFSDSIEYCLGTEGLFSKDFAKFVERLDDLKNPLATGRLAITYEYWH